MCIRDRDHLGYYQGPPIHTVTVFANPFLQDKPSLDQEEEGVHRVEPGEEAPSEGPWHTLYFLPGIHDIGPNFQIHANKTYYIPGEFYSGPFYYRCCCFEIKIESMQAILLCMGP